MYSCILPVLMKWVFCLGDFVAERWGIPLYLIYVTLTQVELLVFGRYGGPL